MQAGRERAGQEMGGGAFDFVEDAAQMGNDDRAQFFGGGGFGASRLLKSGEEAIESDVLAEEKDFVLALKVVVEISGREVDGGSDVAHAGFGEAGDAKLLSGGAEDFQPAGEIAPGEAGVGAGCGAWSRHFAFHER